MSVNIQDIKSKLYERLRPSGWADKLKAFLLSEDMDKLLEYLAKESREGRRFTPPLKLVFRAFEECKYSDLRVIMLLQDPYPFVNCADGIATSCSLMEKAQPSLRFMFEEIERTVYKGDPYPYKDQLDLKRWSNQGVLMLNCALTTTVGKIGQHYNIWQPFMAYLFDVLCFTNTGLVYIFMGKKAQEWSESIPDVNHKIFTVHPAAAAHNRQEKWDSGDVFQKVNNILIGQNGTGITW